MIAIPYYDNVADCRFIPDAVFGGYCGTITAQFGNPAWGHGWKIVEVYEL